MGTAAPSPAMNRAASEDPVYRLVLPVSRLRPTDWRAFRDARHTVMALFADGLGEGSKQARETADILWRVEPSVAGDILVLQASVAPVKAPDGALLGLSYEPISEPQSGALVAFETVVNGIKRKKDGRAEPITGNGLIGEFIAARTGLDVVNVAEHTFWFELPESTHDRRSALQNRRHLVHKNRVRGVGIVRDPDRLRDAARYGVGRSKAYGCGLLTFSPASSIRQIESIAE